VPGAEALIFEIYRWRDEFERADMAEKRLCDNESSLTAANELIAVQKAEIERVRSKCSELEVTILGLENHCRKARVLVSEAQANCDSHTAAVKARDEELSYVKAARKESDKIIADLTKGMRAARDAEAASASSERESRAMLAMQVSQ